MENYHDWINSGILAILVIALFTQNGILKYMKSAMEAINIEKIKQAQEFIEEGNKHKYKLIIDKNVKEAIRTASDRFQETNKDFLDQYNELINFLFIILRDKDWQSRERQLLNYPKNAEFLRTLLDLYDKGEMPHPSDSED